MNRPMFVIALRQAKRIKRQAQELTDLSYAFQRSIRVNHRMADALAAANRDRDAMRQDAELLFRLLAPADRKAAVGLVACRRWIESLETTEEAS